MVCCPCRQLLLCTTALVTFTYFCSPVLRGLNFNLFLFLKMLSHFPPSKPYCWAIKIYINIERILHVPSTQILDHAIIILHLPYHIYTHYAFFYPLRNVIFGAFQIVLAVLPCKCFSIYIILTVQYLFNIYVCILYRVQYLPIVLSVEQTCIYHIYKSCV